jgi:hypothetical protein
MEQELGCALVIFKAPRVSKVCLARKVFRVFKVNEARKDQEEIQAAS